MLQTPLETVKKWDWMGDPTSSSGIRMGAPTWLLLGELCRSAVQCWQIPQLLKPLKFCPKSAPGQEPTIHVQKNFSSAHKKFLPVCILCVLGFREGGGRMLAPTDSQPCVSPAPGEDEHAHLS